MAKDSSKRRPRDVASRAWQIVQEAIGEEEKYEPEEGSEARKEAGRKGGKARAESLTAKQRKEIAKKAAAARWSRDSSD
jgi:hypothetical protein